MLTLIFYIFRGIFIGLFYFVIWTLPIWMLVGGFVWGGAAGGSVNEYKFENWEDEQISAITHNVTIHWGNGETDIIRVREDMPFNIYGSSENASYYNCIVKYNFETTDYLDFQYELAQGFEMPSKAYREGYKLEGFYSGEHGGSLVINAAGYGVITLTSDIDIYANWTLVE